MEASQKRGLFKGKLPKSLARLTKRTPHQQRGSGSGSSKVSPGPPSNSSYGFNSEGVFPWVSTYSYASSKQHPTSFPEQMNVAKLPSSLHKVSNYASFKPPSFYDQNGFAKDTWGHGDKNIDLKATTFISNVRERFKQDTSVHSTGLL